MATFKDRMKQTIISTLDEPAPMTKKSDTPEIRFCSDTPSKGNIRNEFSFKGDPLISRLLNLFVKTHIFTQPDNSFKVKLKS